MSAIRLEATRKSMAAFTLVEVLVALVVMTVGLLGLFTLFVESLRIQRSAIYRTQAVTLAADIAERMRAGGDGEFAAGERLDWLTGGESKQPGRWVATTETLPVGGDPAVRRHDIELNWPDAGRTGRATHRLVVHSIKAAAAPAPPAKKELTP